MVSASSAGSLVVLAGLLNYDLQGGAIHSSGRWRCFLHPLFENRTDFLFEREQHHRFVQQWY